MVGCDRKYMRCKFCADKKKKLRLILGGYPKYYDADF